MRAAVAAMERSTHAFRAGIDGLGDAQWRHRPAGEPWSIAETLEHVVLTDRVVRARLGALRASPSPAGSPRFDDAAITAAMFETVPAPPGLAEPTGCFATPGEGLAALAAECAAIAAWADGATADLRAVGAPHPAFGWFDAVQWILFVAAHTDNHRPQLRALAAHPEIAALGAGRAG